MRLNQHDIDLATRVQRRRDFIAHVTGFLSGAIVLGCLLLAGASSTSLYAATVLTGEDFADAGQRLDRLSDDRFTLLYGLTPDDVTRLRKRFAGWPRTPDDVPGVPPAG